MMFENPLRFAGFLVVLLAIPSLSAGKDLGGPNIQAGWVSLGGRAMYFQPFDETDNSQWYGGAQLRFMLPPFGIEGSADYRKTEFEDTHIDVFPVQTSLLLYLTPYHRVSPFLLGGGGWYFTRVKGPNGLNETQNRFGPHAGGGLQYFLHKYWSLDATYRYVWVEDIQSRDAALVDKEFQDRGYMITLGINHHF